MYSNDYEEKTIGAWTDATNMECYGVDPDLHDPKIEELVMDIEIPCDLCKRIARHTDYEIVQFRVKGSRFAHKTI
jgi:hypothetical protein